MIGAPHVNHLVKPTHQELVAVIGNIYRKIGVESIGAHQNIVLLATKIGGAEPQSPLILIGIARGFQNIHRFGQFRAGVQAAL